MRKAVCIALVLVFAFSLAAAACTAPAATESDAPSGAPSGGGGGGVEGQTDSSDEDLFAEKIVFKWMLSTQNSNPFAETKLYQIMTEKFNIDFEFTELTPNQHIEQVNLKLASRQLPDIITFVDAAVANQYGPEGAFINLDSYLDRMPNLAEQLRISEPFKYYAYTLQNELWFAPSFYSEPIPIFDFSYNKAAFAEVGVTDLSTWDNIYNGLKLIKEKNPQSYQVGFRGGQNGFFSYNLLIASFSEGKCNNSMIGFDYDTDQFVFAPAYSGFKDAIAFFAKLYTEGLIDPEYTYMDQGILVRKVRDGNVVLMADFIGGWTGYPSIMKDVNEVLSPLPIPIAPGKRQTLGPQPSTLGNRGTTLSAELEANPAKLDRALRWLDWMYSQEEFDSYWHHPDVCDMVDGKPVYHDIIYDTDDPDRGNVMNIYFPWSMLCFRDKPDGLARPGSEYDYYVIDVLKGKPELYSVSPVVPFNVDQQEAINRLLSAIEDRFNSEIYDFMEGKRPMSEYDDFTDRLNAAGGTELIKIYNDQYAAIK